MNQLNILINGFVGSHGQEILKRSFEPFSIGTCISIVSDQSDLPTLRVRKLIWENPPNVHTVDWNTIQPLDEELIANMVDCEVVFLEMIEREEDKGRRITYQQRKQKYLQLLRYWNHMIEENNINVFLSCSLPHRVRTYIIYSLCKAKNIPVLITFHAGPLGESHVLIEDLEDFCPQLEKRYKELCASHTDEEAMNMKLPEIAEWYYKQHTSDRKEPPPPYYMLEETPLPTVLERKDILRRARKDPRVLIKQLCSSLRSRCNRDYWVRRMRLFSRLRRAKRMFQWYDNNVSDPDLSARYVYVPLHHQPEASSCPMAGAYSEQRLVVYLLNALLPEDVLLYVKEHPHQQKYFPDGRCRNIDFYKDLLSIPRVRFVSRSFSTNKLTQNACAVATGTGMVGFEALFCGTPVLLFGHWTQQYAPGVFPIRTEADCRTALKAILEEGVKPALPKVRLFLKALEDVSLHGFVDNRYHTYTKEQEEKCVSVFSTAIQERLLQKFKLCSHKATPNTIPPVAA